MKKKFISKKKKKRKSKKLIMFFVFLLGIYFSYYLLSNSKLEIKDKDFIKYLLREGGLYEEKGVSSTKSIKKAIKLITNLDYENPASMLDENYKDLVIKKKEEKKEEEQVTSPIIYLYNSHQTEEYARSSLAPYSISPTVMVADYILQEVFCENGFKTLVEEGSIKEILNQNKWNYAGSYKASRILMENAKSNNPSLVYFIDVHRDSLGKEKTTVTIDGKNYAKTIFLIGLENKNYQENLAFTEKINNKLNELYPNLSKGIYKKGGAGVNGVYNQDFSNRTILLEIGGPDNTIGEVLNTSLAFSKVFMEVIKEYEG